MAVTMWPYRTGANGNYGNPVWAWPTLSDPSLSDAPNPSRNSTLVPADQDHSDG